MHLTLIRRVGVSHCIVAQSNRRRLLTRGWILSMVRFLLLSAAQGAFIERLLHIRHTLVQEFLVSAVNRLSVYLDLDGAL